MNNSLLKDGIKLIIPFFVGLVIGIVMLFKGSAWYWVLLSPVYAIGFTYGISRVGPVILKFLGSMLKAAGSLFLFRLFAWIIVIPIIVVLGLIVLLGVCWLAGFPLAIIDLLRIIKSGEFTTLGKRQKSHQNRNNTDDYYDYFEDDDRFEYEDF